MIFDDANGDELIGASILIQGTNLGTTSNISGEVVLQNIPGGRQTLVVSYLGYETVELVFNFPIEQAQPEKIGLKKQDEELDQIIVEATRANRTIPNLPTRTEVLTEEIDEAASMEPSRIAHLITHSTGIQVQTTAAASNGAVVRIQGLNGRYTQMLQNGFPLYGGFSGSLDVLQIPPLDLRQVEYIKGSASTLYGGGAIGGLINLLTKKPDKDETLLHINFSHIGAKDFNAYNSKRFGKFGMTNLASLHLQSAYDPDNDGFSDVPQVTKFNFNPRFFYFPNSQTEIYFGANISNETRIGGEMDIIEHILPSPSAFFIDDQSSERYTTQFSVKVDLQNNNSLTFRNSINTFRRNIQIITNNIGSITQFGGRQLNSYSEFNYLINKPGKTLNLGINYYSDKFNEDELRINLLRDQEFQTFGAYANLLWDINTRLAIEAGLRTDLVEAESTISSGNKESFVLPRLSALYKFNNNLSMRLGGGMGYRMPTIFNEEAEPFGFDGVQPIDFDEVDAERSLGLNWDLKYQTTFGSDNILLTLNQMFYYNVIDNPILLSSDITRNLIYQNRGEYLKSRGFESQVKLTVGKFTWFLGYTYTDAFLDFGDRNLPLTLTPEHSIKGDLLFVEDGKWRIGWDYEYKSSQILSSGVETRSLFTTGIVVERTLGNLVIFLNAENFTDTRQSKFESLRSGTNNTPQFTDVWAPLDGYFFNAGFKIKL